MQVRVTKDNFERVVNAIAEQERAACDTETTGLYPFHGDRMFGTVFSTRDDDFYFDFNIGGELPRSFVPGLQTIFDRVRYMFFVNFKFDLSMLWQEGLRFPRSMRIIDGGVAARVHYNLHEPFKGADEANFSLDYLAHYYLKINKDDSVMKYIKANDLYKIDVMGEEAPDFARVPTDIMAPYAMSDSRITFDTCEEIIRQINYNDDAFKDERLPGTPTLMTVLARECALSHELFHAYRTGFKIDRKYVEKAIVHENELVEDLTRKIRPLTPDNFNMNSPKQLGEFLISKGVPLPMSEPKRNRKSLRPFKPQPKTDKDTLDQYLEEFDLPVVQMILKCKQAQKKVSTYYDNYLRIADPLDVIHANFNQETTKTGRFSSSEPNVQNLGKEKVWNEWGVRNSFVAFEDFYLACIDFSQQEMRVVADRAQEMGVIAKIIAGQDFYDATGAVMFEVMKIQFDRQTSKKVSLGVTYEQGKALLAKNLKTSVDDAARFKAQFLDALPRVKFMRDQLKKRAERYGKIFTAYGRCIYIDKGFEYKALNAYVQGTSADMTKESIVRCGKLLHDLKAKTLITGTVHDENIFNVHKSELDLIPYLQRAMVDSYPHLHLPMGAEVDLSRTSWAAKVALEKFEDFYQTA